MNLRNIILLALIGLSLASCSDSLGTDPNVRKTPLYQDEISLPVIISNVDWSISESYISPTFTKKVLWGQSVEYLENYIIIDTSGANPKVTIDLEAMSTLSDYFVDSNPYRVYSARLKLDSAEVKGEFIADKKLNNGNWVDVRVKSSNLESTYQSQYSITNILIIEQTEEKKLTIDFFSQISFQHQNEIIRLEMKAEVDY